MTHSSAVLGFRPHTYWTAVVALAGRVQDPQVIARRRIDFAAGLERFIFHQAAEVDLAQAELTIARVGESTRANAAREIGALIDDLERTGVSARLAVTAASSTLLPYRLEEILKAHARMHAAEGSFYRDVVASACAVANLAVHRVVERDLPALVGRRLGVEAPTLEARLKEMGAALGPPWSEDYRIATLAAWLHLDEAVA